MVLSQRRADLLARRADHPDGRLLSGWLSRRAWRILTGAGDRGDPAAIEAVWQSWAQRPSDAHWDLLSRWRDAGELREAACEFALARLTDREQSTDLASFCVTHGLAPEDPQRQLLFYLLTGQQEQRVAADPDGTLTARLYAASDDRTRGSLRQAMSRAGDLDLVRVLAGEAEGQQAALTPHERRYLVEELA